MWPEPFPQKGVYQCFLRNWEYLSFMSPLNLAIREIGFSCRFSFSAPARWESFGLPANGVMQLV